MKPLKKANQMNAEVDRDYYTEREYKSLSLIEGVSSLEDATGMDFGSDGGLRVFFEDVKEIKVALDESGHYCNVAVMNSGEIIHINL